MGSKFFRKRTATLLLLTIGIWLASIPQTAVTSSEAPTQPLLYGPPNGKFTDDTPTYEWTPGGDADNHRLLVDNDSDFTSPEENVLLGEEDNLYPLGWPYSLTRWDFRKELTITGSSEALTDYQLKMVVHKGTGTDNSTDVFIENIKDDFGDVRWTDEKGAELPYWIEELVQENYAIFWVKIPRIPASPDNAYAYMYYSNPAAMSKSDLDSVMDNGLRYFYYDGINFDPFKGTDVDMHVSHNWPYDYRYAQNETISEGGTSGIGAQADDGTYERIHENLFYSRVKTTGAAETENNNDGSNLSSVEGTWGGNTLETIENVDPMPATVAKLEIYTDAWWQDTGEEPKGVTAQIYNDNAAAWENIFMIQSPTDKALLSYTITTNPSYYINADNQIKIRYDDVKDIDGSGYSTIRVDYQYVLVYEYANYRTDVRHDITGIPPGENYELQVKYYTSEEGLKYSYYDGDEFNTFKRSDVDTCINHAWRDGTVTILGYAEEDQADTVSIRWEGWIESEGSGVHTFFVTTDDGSRLWIGDNLVIDTWTDQSVTEHSGTYDLSGIENIVYEWYESTAYAVAALGWGPPGASGEEFENFYPIPSTKLWTTGSIEENTVKENYKVELYNFSTSAWDVVGNIYGGSESAPNLFTYDLTGTNYISGDNVYVRFVQPDNDLTRTDLWVDYVRVRYHKQVQIVGNDWETEFDTVSIRWEGWVENRGSETHTFYVTTNDGSRLWVDENLIIDNWYDQAETEHSATYDLSGVVPIKYEWYENYYDGVAKLGWAPADGSGKAYPIPSSYLRCRKYAYPEPTCSWRAQEEPPTLPEDTFYWKVIAISNYGENESDTWSFTVDITPPQKVENLYEPENGSWVGTTVNFRWSEVEDQSGVSYTIQIDDESSFSAPLVHEKKEIPENTYTWKVKVPAPAPENYYWRVRAVDRAGNLGEFSDWSMFHPDIIPPPAPALFEPADGAVLGTYDLSFGWENVDGKDPPENGPVWYRFELDDEPDFLEPRILVKENLKDNFYSYKLSKEDEYYWRVVAIDEMLNENESKTYSFEVKAPFSLTSVTELLTIVRGGSGSFTVYVEDNADIPGDDTVTFDNQWIGDIIPSGVTVEFDPSSGNFRGGTSSTVTVRSEAMSSTGKFTLQVIAESESGLKRILEIEIEVSSIIFSINVSPQTLCLTRGDEASSRATVRLVLGAIENVHVHGYWFGKVKPTAADISVTIDPKMGVPDFDSKLTFTTTKEATPGKYIFRVEAYDGGLVRTKDMGIEIKHQLSLTVSTDQTSYEKGQEIIISGGAYDPKGQRVENGTVTIVFTCGEWSEEVHGTIERGIYLVPYFIAFDKPLGKWEMTIKAVDIHGNVTPVPEEALVDIVFPELYKHYTVILVKPEAGEVYTRGQEVEIIVDIKDEGETVRDAKVMFRVPSGKLITLTERTPGEYVGSYRLGWDEPTGEWQVQTLGEKTEEGVEKGGSAYVPVRINPINLTLELLNPAKRDFEVGEEFEIEIKATYGDTGILADEAQLYALLAGENVTLWNRGGGIYGTTYSFGNPAKLDLQIFGSDAYGNSGMLEAGTVAIVPIPVTGYPIRYWWATLSAIFVAALSSAYVIRGRLRLLRLQSIGGEREEIDRLREKAAIDYFREGAISRPDYDSLIKDYEQRLMELEKEEFLLRRKLKKKIE